MQVELEQNERDDCLKAAKLIDGAFVWEETPEGHDYWEDVSQKLRSMAESGTTNGEPLVPRRLINKSDALPILCQYIDEFGETHLGLCVYIQDESDRRFCIVDDGNAFFVSEATVPESSPAKIPHVLESDLCPELPGPDWRYLLDDEIPGEDDQYDFAEESNGPWVNWSGLTEFSDYKGKKIFELRKTDGNSNIVFCRKLTPEESLKCDPLPDGFRLLSEDEITQEGDMLCYNKPEHSWIPNRYPTFLGKGVKDLASKFNPSPIFARKIGEPSQYERDSQGRLWKNAVPGDEGKSCRIRSKLSCNWQDREEHDPFVLGRVVAGDSHPFHRLIHGKISDMGWEMCQVLVEE